VEVCEYGPQGAEDRWQEAYEKLQEVIRATPRLDLEGEGT
jgi:hypothetical protein